MATAEQGGASIALKFEGGKTVLKRVPLSGRPNNVAIAKDGAMAAITVFVIIFMAILFGAELGPKADPTTTTYTPRPEWYFFFLFELLRVVKPPSLVFLATVGIPTICLVLLLLLLFR